MEEPIFEHCLHYLLCCILYFKTIVFYTTFLHSHIKHWFVIKLVICSNSEKFKFHNFHNIVPIGVLKKHPLVTDLNVIYFSTEIVK